MSKVAKQKASLELTARIIANLSKNVTHSLIRAESEIRNCSGVIICSGVGKSAFVAAKFSSSLRSIGVRSSFIHGSDAMHGDLGFLNPEDIVLIVSKSGRTEELRTIHRTAMQIGCKTISVLGEDESFLASASTVFVHASAPKEADKLGVLPTNSSLAAQACLDLLAAEIADGSSITESVFSKNHPGGSLGLSTQRLVTDNMISKKQVGKAPVGSEMRRIASILTEFPVGIAIITDHDDHPIGIITDGDVRRALLNPGFNSDLPVDIFMNTKPLFLESTDSVRQARAKLIERSPSPVFVAPIRKEGEIIGITNIHLLS